MKRKLLLQQADHVQKVKDMMVFNDPQKLKMVLSKLSWKILLMLSEKEMYPLEIARTLGIHEQKVYYHVRKMVRAGAIVVAKEEEKKGATAKYFKPSSQAFGIELPMEYKTIRTQSLQTIGEQAQKFFREFIQKDGSFSGKIIVGSPTPHGPFKTIARDGHYASHLAFFLGQFVKMPEEFEIKLDVDVKAEKEEKSNLILIGGPGTNLLTQELNEFLPTRFAMQSSEQGFIFGGLISNKTSNVYTADAIGLVAKIVNPWNKNKRIIVLAGNKSVGTKACVLALTDFHEKTLRGYQEEDAFARVVQGFDLDGDGKVDSTEVLE